MDLISFFCWLSSSYSGWLCPCPQPLGNACPHWWFNELTVTHKKDGRKLVTYQNLKESTAFPVRSCKCCWTNPSVSKYFIQNLTRKIFRDYLFWSNAYRKPVEKSMHYNLFIPQTPFSSFFLHQQCVHVLFILVLFSLYFPELTFPSFLSLLLFAS